jgi:thymidine phosphorylase
MSQPLGDAIGNALDIVEAVELLRGRVHERLRDAAVMFAGEGLSQLTGVGMGEGRAAAASALDDGRALEAFRAMIAAQGGDPRVVDDPEGLLPRAPIRKPIVADVAGTLAVVDAEVLGRASGDLGPGGGKDRSDRPGGRCRVPAEDRRSHRGRPELGEIRAHRGRRRARAPRVRSALKTVEGPVEPPPLVYDWHGQMHR